MENSGKTSEKQKEQRTIREKVLICTPAALLALPNGVIIWFVVMYPVFGVTGVMMPPIFHIATFLMASLFVFVWSLYGSQTIAEVVYRSCRFGALLALLLPVTTGMISLMWAFRFVERPPAALPEFSLLEIPVHAATAALILILLFLAGSFLAARKMEGVPF